MQESKTPNRGKITGLKAGIQKRMWKYEPEALNKILEEFYTTVRTKDGEVMVIVTDVDPNLTGKEYKPLIFLKRVWSKFLRKMHYYSGNKARASGRIVEPQRKLKTTKRKTVIFLLVYY